MRSLFNRLCLYFFIPRCAAVALVALSWSCVTFAGEIHNAARRGDVSKVATLLNRDSNLVFSKDEFGRTPLHEAANIGHKDVAELLLSRGANVNAKDDYATTPLERAAANGYREVAELPRISSSYKKTEIA